MSRSYSVARRRQQKAKQEKKRKQIIFAVGVLAVVFLGILLWSGLQSNRGEAGPALIAFGYPAPNFELETLTGETAVLEDYQGDVVLINFWATWCPPCKAEMPDINAFYQANQNDGLTVLAVNAQEDKSTVGRFIESNGFVFPVLLDPVGDVARQFQVNSFPTTIILDRDGTIQTIHNGLITAEQLDAVVTPLLAQ